MDQICESSVWARAGNARIHFAMSETIHTELSDLTDKEENIYKMTRDLAAVAKQIKEDSKEETDPPNPVLEAVDKTYQLSQ